MISLKNFSISLRQFTVLSLLGLAVWLKSPLIACAVVVALIVKEGREYLASKDKSLETQILEAQINVMREELRRLQGEMNQIIVRTSQYFGD